MHKLCCLLEPALHLCAVALYLVVLAAVLVQRPQGFVRLQGLGAADAEICPGNCRRGGAGDF
jgi:hypothetical protein